MVFDLGCQPLLGLGMLDLEGLMRFAMQRIIAAIFFNVPKMSSRLHKTLQALVMLVHNPARGQSWVQCEKMTSRLWDGELIHRHHDSHLSGVILTALERALCLRDCITAVGKLAHQVVDGTLLVCTWTEAR